jgi:heme iron utilization protein
MDEQSKEKLIQLIQTQQIASLGTSVQGQPLVSMVLYGVSVDFTMFHVHISQLAKHTQNIMANPRVSLMISESVRTNINPQTLARISIMGKASLLSGMSAEYASAKEQYLEKYPFAKMNFQLGDFALYEIKLETARYVAGFGKAYNLSLEDMRQFSA